MMEAEGFAPSSIGFDARTSTGLVGCYFSPTIPQSDVVRHGLADECLAPYYRRVEGCTAVCYHARGRNQTVTVAADT